MLPSEMTAFTIAARRLARLEVIERLLGELQTPGGGGPLVLPEWGRATSLVRVWLKAARDQLLELSRGQDANGGQGLVDTVLVAIDEAGPGHPPAPPTPEPVPAEVELVDSTPSGPVESAAPGGVPGEPRGVRMERWCREHGLEARALAIIHAHFGATEFTALTDAQIKQAWTILRDARPREPAPPTAPPSFRSTRPVGAYNENGYPIDPGWPRSAKALFAWCKTLQDLYRRPILEIIDRQFVDQWGWPSRYRDWADDQIQDAAAAVAVELRRTSDYTGHADSYLLAYERARDQARSALYKAATEAVAAAGTLSPTWSQILDRIAALGIPVGDPVGPVVRDPAECGSLWALNRAARTLTSEIEISTALDGPPTF